MLTAGAGSQAKAMPRQRDGAARGGEAAARRGICTCPDLHAGATRRVPSSGHNARPLLLLLLALCLSIHRLLRRLSRCRLIALKLLLSCLPCLGVEGAWAGRCLLRVQLLGGQSKVASRGVGGWGRGVHLATRLLLVRCRGPILRLEAVLELVNVAQLGGAVGAGAQQRLQLLCGRPGRGGAGRREGRLRGGSGAAQARHDKHEWRVHCPFCRARAWCQAPGLRTAAP